MLRDLLKGKDRQIKTVQAIINRVAPDVLLLNTFDFDLRGVALEVFADQLTVVYPYRFALAPNSVLLSGLDLDGDGRLNGAGDRQGFGRFSGSGGMALLSRFPIKTDNVKDFSNLLWRDLAGAQLPVKNGQPFPSFPAQQAQRLASRGLWDVPVRLPDGRILHVLASHATPPVFDGPEDLNGMRNRDEIRFWSEYLRKIPLGELFVIVGDLNADPKDGEGAHLAISRLISDPRLNDPQPKSAGGVAAAIRQSGPNLGHNTPASLDTVDWDEARTPGNMRVDYVLPSKGLNVVGAGVFWPTPKEDGFDLVGLNGDIGAHHRLVWVDVK